MPRKKKKKKKKQIPEFLKSTAIYAAWQRLAHCGFSVNSINNKIKLTEPNIYTSIERYKAGVFSASTFYEHVDCYIATILVEYQQPDDLPIIGEKFIDLYKLIITQFDNLPPGFEPLGENAALEFGKFFQGHINLTAAIVSWAISGKQVYTISPTLSEMLLYTKLNKLDCMHVRLPFDTIYVAPPINTWKNLPIEEHSRDLWNMHDEEIDGVVVTETLKGSVRSLNYLTLAFVQTRTGKSITGIHKHQNITLTPGDTIEKVLETQLGDTDPFFVEIFKYITAVSLYITSIDADIILSKDSVEYAQWVKELNSLPSGHKLRKNLQKTVDNVRNTNTQYLGRLIKIDRHKHTEKTSNKNTHASPIPHYRSGHFRSQPYGPKDKRQYRNIWIKPQIVGMKNISSSINTSTESSDINTEGTVRIVQ